jgi:SAM-dependent methyltransferase
MGTVTWGRDIAEVYDRTTASTFAPEVLGPTVDFLAELSSTGRALEFAIGTGRVGLALSARGVKVHGIELSPHMADQLRAKPGANDIGITIGDMASTRLNDEFDLVYLVFNTIMNVTTQAEQVAVFANAAAHLVPGGRFVVEVIVPQLRRVPLGESIRMFTADTDHIGFETFEDQVGQISWSHHWMVVDGALVRESAPYRYVWPSELDLMAQLAGLRLVERWSSWTRQPFTSDSTTQVAVFEK